MAANTGWKLLAAIGALTLGTLAINACGDDTTPAKDTGGDGDGDGDADAGAIKTEPLLPADTAGKACTADPECGSKGKCQDELTGGSAVGFIGDLLGVNLDLSSSVEGGYCSATCKKDEDCNTGGACFGIPPAGLDLGPVVGGFLSGECRKKCTVATAATDCRPGYECAELDKDALTAALGDMASQFGSFLTVASTCVPAPKPGQIDDATVGKACSVDSDCPGTGGVCQGAVAATDGGAATQGTCSAVCTADTQCGATEGVCAGILYGTGGTCAEKCNKATDCKGKNFTCTDLLGNKVCLPPTMLPETESDAGSDAAVGDAG